jgi:hypothetical protein
LEIKMSNSGWIRAARSFAVSAFRDTALAAVLSAAVLAAPPALAQVPDSAVSAMEQRLQALQQQLDQLNSTQDPASQQGLMQQNWQGMQGYLGWMNNRWNLGIPWMSGYHGQLGGPMMGGQTMGSPGGAWWPLPEGLSPANYSQQVHGYMQEMQRQMGAIAQSHDAQVRLLLLEQHWQYLYQHMQAMRGMGWMWAGPTTAGMTWRPLPGVAKAKPLPDLGSRGATLVTTYCTQCHAAPSPTLHTVAEWASVTSRMQPHMSRGPSGIKLPTGEEMQVILAYMQQHAR